MAHPFASSEHTIYPSPHVYAEPTMIGVFPMSNQPWNRISVIQPPRIDINDGQSATTTSVIFSPKSEATRVWWPRTNTRASKSCLKRAAYVVVAIILIVLWIVLTLLFARDEVVNQATNQVTDDTPLSLMLQGTLKSFDPSQGSLTINWFPSDKDGNAFGTSDNMKQEIGIFRDQVAIQDTEHTPISGWTGSLRRVDNTSAPAIAVVGQHTWDSFSTEIEFHQMHSVHKGVLGYPMDQWTGSIVLVANAQDWARRAQNVGSYVVPIIGATLEGSSVSWKVTMKTENTCTDAIATDCALKMDFTATRSGFVKFTVLFTLVLNWIITLFLLTLTCECVFIHRRTVFYNVSLLAICFIALITIPSVHFTLSGAPHFGTMIDFIGVVPNVVAIALCIMMLAVSCLRHSLQQPVQQQLSSPVETTSSSSNYPTSHYPSDIKVPIHRFTV